MTESRGPDIAKFSTDALSLAEIDAASADILAREFVQMDPWLSLGFAASSLARYFMTNGDGCHRFLILRDGELVGALALRSPWLRGSYLEFLGLRSEFQGSGIGRKVLEWQMHCAIDANQGNIWVAVSKSNKSAIRFYEAFGFSPVADLPDLVLEGHTEILMRMQLSSSNS